MTAENPGTDLGTWAVRRPDAEAVVIVDPRYTCPRELRCADELPRSEAGKIVKRDLRRALEAAEAESIAVNSSQKSP